MVRPPGLNEEFRNVRVITSTDILLLVILIIGIVLVGIKLGKKTDHPAYVYEQCMSCHYATQRIAELERAGYSVENVGGVTLIGKQGGVIFLLGPEWYPKIENDSTIRLVKQ